MEVVHVRFQGRWQALYIDGERVTQGHEVTVGDVLGYVEGKTVEEARSEWNPVNLEQEFGAQAPERYDELPDCD